MTKEELQNIINKCQNEMMFKNEHDIATRFCVYPCAVGVSETAGGCVSACGCASACGCCAAISPKICCV